MTNTMNYTNQKNNKKIIKIITIIIITVNLNQIIQKIDLNTTNHKYKIEKKSKIMKKKYYKIMKKVLKIKIMKKFFLIKKIIQILNTKIIT